MKKIYGDKTPVTLIAQKGDSALVEYIESGVPIRKYVPTREVNNNRVADEVLSAGIPYGFPWAEISVKFDPQKFENEMHQVGLWTTEDLLKSPQKVWSALRATFADNVSEILDIAKSEKGVKRHGK
jgi:hypothetical protein